MRKTVFTAILALVGFGSIAVLGSTPGFIERILVSVRESAGWESSGPLVISGSPIADKDASVFFATTEKGKNSQIAGNEPSPVPDRIIYYIFFRHLTGLKTRSEALISEGRSMSYLDIIEKDSGVNNLQSQFLFQTAERCLDETKQIDDEARSVVENARAKFPNGEVKSPNDIPPPPSELILLQQRKDETVLRFLEEVRAFLGEDRFAEFDRYVRAKTEAQLQSLSNGGTK